MPSIGTRSGVGDAIWTALETVFKLLNGRLNVDDLEVQPGALVFLVLF